MPEQVPEVFTLDTLVLTTDLTGYTVVRHGYRKCRVTGGDVTDGPFTYGQVSDLNYLQYRLAAAAGSGVDRNESYEVTNPDGQKLCLWFHDWRVAAGTALQPY